MVELVEVFDKRSIDISSLAMVRSEFLNIQTHTSGTVRNGQKVYGKQQDEVDRCVAGEYRDRDCIVISVLIKKWYWKLFRILKEPHVQDVMQNNTPIEICDSAL